MADFFKGLAGGFGTGLQFGQAMQARQERERLREAMGLTPQEMQQRQATPEEFGRAQAETQALAARDAQEFGLTPQDQPAGISYAPQMPVEGQRIGATQYGLGGQTFNRMPTQQEIESARYSAAANVLAERDPMAAMRMRQEQVRMQREAEESPLRLEQLRQQGILTAGQIEDRNRERTRIKGIEAVDTGVADFMTKRLTGPDGELRQPTMDDNIAAMQYRATALQKGGFNKEATDSLKDYQTFAVNQITLDTNQRNAQLGPVAAALAAGDLGPARAFYDRYVVDGAKVTDMKADPKTGAITVSRVRDDGTPMPDRVIKGGTNELLATLNTFKDPTALYTFSQNEFNNNLKLEELDLNKKKADDLAKYYRDVAGSRGATGLKQKVADFKEVYGRDPTEEEKGVLAGLTTKAPNKPEADRDAWLKAEQKLIEADSSPEVIDAQRTAFFVRRGYAPAAARQVLEAGVNPATGKPLTRSDVDAYNATYPQTPVEPGSLPWLPSPEREARRQGLISQIPK